MLAAHISQSRGRVELAGEVALHQVPDPDYLVAFSLPMGTIGMQPRPSLTPSSLRKRVIRMFGPGRELAARTLGLASDPEEVALPPVEDRREHRGRAPTHPPKARSHGAWRSMRLRSGSQAAIARLRPKPLRTSRFLAAPPSRSRPIRQTSGAPCSPIA